MTDIRRTVAALCLLMLLFPSCRKEEGVLPSTSRPVTYPDPDLGPIKGFFLLNEGNMGSNKATLDYFDYETGVYTKNIYAERNPGVVKELGDVGNDLQIYGDRLYAVINCSNLVEVMDVATAKHIGTVSIPNCRYIVFKDQYAYVSSYAGPVEFDPNYRLGYVAKVDTATLQVVGECTVGYQPEQMVIAGDKLYVANSGGYRFPNYDTRVSVIDLNRFETVEQIDTGIINLHCMELDRYGNIWVSSRGDYYTAGSKTFVIDSDTDEVTDILHLLPNGGMTRCGDSLYVYSAEWSYVSEKYTFSYAVVDTQEKKVVSRRFITDGTDKKIAMPYGIAVNPDNGDILVADAKDFVTPGTLYCFDAGGKKKWSVTTGDIPAHIAFTHKRLQPIE